ncbi:hypothetical protein K439DRAFT_1623267 [Ramaria rubella]|nr:hypothetical protein K439DRAFT_1623267 [Ramaria rubella]
MNGAEPPPPYEAVQPVSEPADVGHSSEDSLEAAERPMLREIQGFTHSVISYTHRGHCRTNSSSFAHPRSPEAISGVEHQQRRKQSLRCRSSGQNLVTFSPHKRGFDDRSFASH